MNVGYSSLSKIDRVKIIISEKIIKIVIPSLGYEMNPIFIQFRFLIIAKYCRPTVTGHQGQYFFKQSDQKRSIFLLLYDI